jgi:chromosome partitioning protein
LSFDIRHQLEERFPDTICRTVTAETVSLAESPVRVRISFADASHSQGAKGYRALTEELEAGNFFA